MPKGIYIYSLIATLALGFCLALFFTGKASFTRTSTSPPAASGPTAPNEVPLLPTNVLTQKTNKFVYDGISFLIPDSWVKDDENETLLDQETIVSFVSLETAQKIKNGEKIDPSYYKELIFIKSKTPLTFVDSDYHKIGQLNISGASVDELSIGGRGAMYGLYFSVGGFYYRLNFENAPEKKYLSQDQKNLINSLKITPQATLLPGTDWKKISSKAIGSDSCDTDSPKVKALNAYLDADNPAYQKQIGDFNYSVKWHDNTPPEVYSGINVFYVPNTFNLSTNELLATPACGIPSKTILGATDDKIFFSKGCSGGLRPDSDSEFTKFQSYVNDCQRLTISLSKQFTSDQTTSNSDQNIQTIKNYYNFLSDKNLTEAYKMYSGSKKPSWPTYQTWYKDLISAQPSKYFMLPGGVYRFDVELVEKPNITTYYGVSMKVTNGKIETLSSDQIASPSDNFKNDYRAEARKAGTSNSLVLLDKNGSIKKLREYTYPQITLYEYADGDTAEEKYIDPKFSSDGQTIAYHVVGWDFTSLNFYSLKLRKALNKDFAYGKAFFSQNGQKAIVCAGGEFAGPNFLGVYNLDNLSLEKDLTELLASNMNSPSCEEQEGNRVKVSQSTFDNPKYPTKQFFVDF